MTRKNKVSESIIEAFIQRWNKAGGSERANYQLFLTELCTLLSLPQPEPACNDTRDNAYVFERRVIMAQPDGSSTNGFIDLYRRGSFVLEAKQTGKTLDSSGWDKAMLRAYNQADQYVRALSVDEGRPPFIIIVDVGRNIELYAEFSRSGATYTPYPDPRSHRIRLEDLRDESIRQRLVAVWQDPLSLDPARYSARVTRQISDQLASLAKSLELAGHTPQTVAGFLMRALFTMFSEDVGLLPERSFTELLHRLRAKPANFVPMLENLWQTMNTGGFSPILESKLLRFNGGLFSQPTVIALDRDQLELLIAASEADWRYVEPAIFGTLLERALNPKERHKLGAHYTPRAYVERLVLPTLMEPLRKKWQEVQVAALAYEQQSKHTEALAEISAFHQYLCSVRVLDPACGSGNFLYVALEHMKRLEGEVLNLIRDLDKNYQEVLDLRGVTVDPHQFLGLEINPRAAQIAEMVLWIGYLQWYHRAYGDLGTLDPVLHNFHNIENRDALLCYQQTEAMLDETGQAITRWDGLTYKTSPITGEQIPDESAQIPQYRYLSPSKAVWPQADYIIGNPPFIGAATMRRALGDGYVDAVRSTWKGVPESADFVMYWWHIASEKVRTGSASRFGFITTNSIRQTFNRRVIQAQLEAKPPLSLAFAVPDHPWVDAADGAAVRIAMTTGQAGNHEGQLLRVIAEQETSQDDIEVTLQAQQGRLFANLAIGADIVSCSALKANLGISSPGFKLHGAGFIVQPEEAASLGLGSKAGLEKHIRAYRNGRDLTDSPRGVMVIDLFGLTSDETRERYPEVYQHVLERVKPERDAKGSTKDGAGYAKKWWLFGKPRQELRRMLKGLPRYITTVETAKHRIFQFLAADIAPDNKLVLVALDDAYSLGILSSRIHTAWALASGSRLGVGNDPVYVKTSCFETFPFPAASAAQQAQISSLSEKIDSHRKRQQATHPDLTLTGMYNVLEKLRREEALSDKERKTNNQGLLSVLRELHDKLDQAVFAAYGWSDLGTVLVGRPGATTPLPDKDAASCQAEETLLQRLVTLNAQRAKEESQGKICWLRPAYQNPQSDVPTQQVTIAIDADRETDHSTHPSRSKETWPKAMREQVAVVRQTLSGKNLSTEAIANHFKRSPKVAVQAVLDALEGLGMVQQTTTGSYQLLG